MAGFDLQKESDVKDYIEKLGIEYRFGCYSEKKPEGKHFAKCLKFSTLIFTFSENSNFTI